VDRGASRLPLRRFEIRDECVDDVTTAVAASHEVDCSTECCKQLARGPIGLPTPRFNLVISDGLRGFYQLPSAAHFRRRFHPLRATSLSRVLLSLTRLTPSLAALQ
jgi:hypothetical protein